MSEVKRKLASGNEGSGVGATTDNSTASQIAHTLTACTRCRQRKSRCDPALPRCTPCERTNSVCEYWDANRGQTVNRNYVVYLQHRVRELENELDMVENEDLQEDPEAMMRAATVRVHETQETKYLGASSGIAITRLVMQLAKQFTDAKSIKDIVPEQRARQIKELYNQEQAKPTSKVYPLISDVAAVELPNRALADLLVQVYKLKVQPMYPALHEPTLDRDMETVYETPGQASPFQHFISRMVIAISLQKMDTQYAGLADSYYLAALKYLEPVVRPMDLKSLQCFALMAEYSLLTPTRTAIYYVVGIAVRLAQALGLNEEKMITRRTESGINYLEIDMKRRLFWCILTMELGLAHSLGRPAMLATGLEHIDVGWFETCDDKYITPEGIDPAAPRPTLKKWVSIHFFKMRLLQLEIRRKLYQRTRTEPKDDSDPWFVAMEAKLAAWRDASPSQDEGHGLDKIWFIGRYNTMVVFLYRPSPQVPRPSLEAAQKCFDACEYNIYMQREQITQKNVDLTWIFTQSLFMAINCMLWSLSYVEVRRKHKRELVERHLEVAMDAIQLASDRWPGVASAVQLYHNLILAIMKIYEKDEDIPIAATTPSEAPSPGNLFAQDLTNHSMTASPATASTQSVTTPPPHSYLQPQARRSVEQPPPTLYQSESMLASTPSDSNAHRLSSEYTPSHYAMHNQQYQPQQQIPSDPNIQYDALPQFSLPGWTHTPQSSMPYTTTPGMGFPLQQGDTHPAFNPQNPAYPYPIGYDGTSITGGGDQTYMPQWEMDTGAFGNGLTQMQQEELMHSLETDGMEDIQSMITSSLAAMTPKQAQNPTF